MKRSLYALVTAAMLTTAAATAHAATSVQISIGDRYDGPSLYFRSEPSVVLVPDTRVYYVRNYDHDLYRYGRYWYFVEDGYWYRATSWRGPFVHIRTGTVPRYVTNVPVKYRRNWNGPPAHAVAKGHYKNRRDYDRRDNDRRDYDRHDNDRGKGHGKGNKGKGH